jgi:hypothetical protein
MNSTPLKVAFILLFCSVGQIDVSGDLNRSTPGDFDRVFNESRFNTVDDILVELNENNSKNILQEFEDISSLNFSKKNFASKCCFKASSLPENQDKNRFPQYKYFTFDHSRVVLKREGNLSDYINANYVDGFQAKNEFIATQGRNLLERREICLKLCNHWQVHSRKLLKISGSWFGKRGL